MEGVDSLKRSLRFLTIIRLVVISTIVLSSILIQAAAGLVLPLTPLYALAGLAFTLSGLYAYAGQRLKPAAQAYLQLTGDVFLVTALVYFSGGADSVFSFLYLVVIAAASLLLMRRGGLAIASLASLSYGVIIEFLEYGLLPAPPLSGLPDWSGPRLVFHLAVNILGFYGVAVLTSVMAEKLSSARAEILTRRSEFERIRALHSNVIESMSSGLETLDFSGRLTFLNRAGGVILRTSESEAVGRFVWEVGPLTPEGWSAVRDALAQGNALRGETAIAGERGERTIGYSTHRLKGTSGLLLLFQDLTEMKKLESEALAREKLAAVGQMAAGIAHEIRNPLASISGSAQMLQAEMPQGSAERRLLEIIMAESKRLSKTLEDFLRYARPSKPRRETFDVAGSLSEAMDLFSHSDEVHEGHRLSLDITPARSLLSGDPDNIRQIFWNVAKNAIRAMPDGGTLSVTGREDGGWYAILFQDSGKGMTASEKERLFQPFAAAFDGGTGLGMAIVRRLIEDHGGQIEVESRPERGTRIEIRLPRKQGSLASSAA
jgi:two-component system sensor histidine kinase PilS (NtrC family)